MVTPELLDFIREQLATDMSKDEIIRLLQSDGGWARADIDEGFLALKDKSNPEEKSPETLSKNAQELLLHRDAPDSTVNALHHPPLEEVNRRERIDIASPLPTQKEVVESDKNKSETKNDNSIDSLVEKYSHAEFFDPVGAETLIPTAQISPEKKETIVSPVTQSAPVEKKNYIAEISKMNNQQGGNENVTPKILVVENFHIKDTQADDFLGIFDTEEPGAQESAGGLRNNLTEPSVLKTALPHEVPHGEIKDLITNLGDVQNEDAPVDQSLDIMSAVNNSSPNIHTIVTETDKEPESVFKFDFAKMKSDSSVQPYAQSDTAQESEGKLAAEGVKDADSQKNQVSPSQASVNNDVPQRKKSVLVERRTMASDLLLRGLAPIESTTPKAPTPVASPAPTITPLPPQSPVAPSIPTGTPPTSVPPEAQSITKDFPGEDTPKISLTSIAVPNVTLAESSSRLEVAGDDNQKRESTKRIMKYMFVGVLTAIFLTGAFYVFTKFKNDNSKLIFDSAISQFFAAESFAYSGVGDIDLVFTSILDKKTQVGGVKMSFDYDGKLLNSNMGYGDGLHRIKLSGAVDDGALHLPTEIETNISIIGSTLYFHVLSLPETANLDPELAKKYWFEIDLAALAKELALSGVVVRDSEYGSFGGQNPGNSFTALLKQFAPIESSKLLPETTLNGDTAQHIALTINGEQAVQFIVKLYPEFFGKELVMSKEERIRFVDALSKMTGDVWVDNSSGQIIKLSIAGDFDDDMLGRHVKGTLSINFGFTDFNKSLDVTIPSPILTLEELKVQIEKYPSVRDMRIRDKEKVDRLHFLRESLSEYYVSIGRFPTTLTELYDTRTITTVAISEEVLKQYVYTSYVSNAPFTRAKRCGTKSPLCEYYHIGVNLEEVESPMLSNDDDEKSEMDGLDTAGCMLEKEFACYDIVGELEGVALESQAIKPAVASTNQINGKTVPSCVIDETLNNASIKGIDTDNNGIRDDVDCFIAKEFGKDGILYSLAIADAQTLQAVLIHKVEYTQDEKVESEGVFVPKLVKAHIDAFRCIKDPVVLKKLSVVSALILNTPQRKSVYGEVFAGAYISSDGCPD